MKKTNYILLVLLLIVIFSSCDDAFTTIRELELPEHEKKLSVFSTMYGSTCEIFVSHSKSIDDNSPYKQVTANVIIRKNDMEFFSFVYPDDLKTGNLISPFIDFPKSINEGEKYTLEVVSDEFGTAKAVSTVPELPVIDNITYDENYYIEEYDTLDKLEFNIIDPEENDNYYLFNINSTIYKRNKYHLYLYISTDDPIIKETYWDFDKGIIISDKTFNGQKRKISLKVNYYANINPNEEKIDLDTVLINSKGITKDYYNFLLSKIQHDQADDNPFAEPVNIYNNIENGYGLFSIENSEVKVIKIK